MNINITGDPVITLNDSYNGIVFKTGDAKLYIRRIAGTFALTMTTKKNVTKHYVIDFETGEVVQR